MKILHVLLSKISLPPQGYGGTERVVWALAKAQQQAGHEVRFLWGKAPNLPSNAKVADKRLPLATQIDDWPDIVHFHCPFSGELHKPYISTEHGNARDVRTYDMNTVFLSQRHALNHHADCFVYNGLDWSEYGAPELTSPNSYFHFLGKANWPLKNLRGAIDLARASDIELSVLGGRRLNFSKKFYCYFDRKVKFKGMIGGDKKHQLIRKSQGLIFPVRWHEPFGLAVIESLFLGTPVLSSPYGALPELITLPEIGILSTDSQQLIDAIRNITQFKRRVCHEYAKETFNHNLMAKGYDDCYQKVLDGQALNSAKPYNTHNLHQIL
ncbi:MAG: glucosyl transferase [Gammaproteobacteria bacterium MedPE]|nr:MAG: glucosyl transferase [Gammaproteobacteria bacterium MedPE]